ncbi:hypothetical protein ACPXB3_18170 [Gordonia sp. DT219]|uniref:hypothetical protein n=1 Tax=Gordonia sp. DT219 TaxID=3416658 RepID=UPI003CFA4DE5
MTNVTADEVVEELRLTPQQTLALRTMQARMLLADVNAESKNDTVVSKTEYLHSFVSESFRTAVPDPTDPAEWLPDDLATFEGHTTDEQVEIFAGLAPVLAGQVRDRSAALIVLVELLTFSPWDDGSKWDKKSRVSSLELAATELAGLRDGDLKTMTEEFESLMKALRRKSVRWGRVAAATVVGAGIGVLTAGWAAPAIGGAIGGAMGLTGAAATSAGLAALGGGSLAAGGFGIAGGTLLLSGVGGFAFAGAAAAGTRFSPLASRTIAAEAVKLDLVARMVLADAPNRDEKIRRVVESLQETINDLSDRTKLLVDRIESLKAEKSSADAENTTLRDQIKALKAELDGIRAATTTLTVVRDRLPKSVTA